MKIFEQIRETVLETVKVSPVRTGSLSGKDLEKGASRILAIKPTQSIVRKPLMATCRLRLHSMTVLVRRVSEMVLTSASTHYRSFWRRSSE